MADSTKYPDTATDEGSDWYNPEYIKADDGDAAEVRTGFNS